MTVSVVNPQIRYPYTGPTDYQFPFFIYKETDLRLVHVDTAGAANPLELTTDYMVTIVPGSGGYCTLIAPSVSGGFLDIRRELPIEQSTDYVNNDPFDMEILETDLDRIVMVLQQLQVSIDKGDAATNWRGDWSTGEIYVVQDLIRSPEASLYVCMTDHTAGVDFSADLQLGYWELVIDVEAVESARIAAVAAAAEALQSEAMAKKHSNSAMAQAIAAEHARNEADAWAHIAASEADDAIDAKNQAIPAGIAAEHWAQYPENQGVPESQNPPEFSAYHWMKKAQQIAGGGVTSISGIGAVVIDNTDPKSPIIGVPAIPSGGLTGQVLAKAANADFDTEWKAADHDTYEVKFNSGGTPGFLDTHIATPAEVEDGLINDKLLTPANIAVSILAMVIPTGAVIPFAGLFVSDDWLRCDGSEVAKADYPELWAFIQDTFGTPADPDNFVLPLSDDMFFRGASATRPIGTVEASANKAHVHYVPAKSGSVSGDGAHVHGFSYSNSGAVGGAYVATDYRKAGNSNWSGGGHSHTCAIGAQNTHSDGDTEARPINTALMYYIKT